MRKPKQATSFPGVRFREHEERKHGVRFDRYFTIRYKVNGKDKEEGVGWASAGMTAEKANRLLGEIRENIRTGKGPQSLAEMRAETEKINDGKRQAEEDAQKRAVSFGTFFEESYFPATKLKKKEGSLVSEMALFKKWLAPVLASISLREITYPHLEKIIRNMTEAGRAKRSIKYALAVVSQVWTYARDKGIVDGDSPTKKFTVGKLDNERVRFLTQEEAKRLLDSLGKHSLDVRDMAKLSLLCGLRAGEIFKLTWADVDMENETIILRNTKSGESRYAYFAGDIRAIFEERMKSGVNRESYVFPSSNGKTHMRISKTFARVVKELGLNDGIEDPRQKVVFHTLRHTFASWLSQRGTSLYSIQNLMGHSEYRMTQRYAHLNPEGMRKDVRVLDGILENSESATSPARIVRFRRAE
ncbi:MAG: site-specific integrase [Desulfovibrio sp.]|nr:site-specific integrase [Desulfovibrio sp.]